MSNTRESIIQEIISYVSNDSYSNWYAGITADPDERLFNAHNVDNDKGRWIYQRTNSSSDARAIEKYLLEKLGMSGGPGGGDYTSKIVYAYKKTPTLMRVPSYN